MPEQALHVCINVSNADESIEFYKQFGFEESWQFTTGDGETTHYYLADQTGFEIQLSESTGSSDLTIGTGWDHLAIGVADVDETIAEINHYGITQEAGLVPEAGTYVAFIEDPDGHVVELVEQSEE